MTEAKDYFPGRCDEDFNSSDIISGKSEPMWDIYLTTNAESQRRV